MQKSKLESVIGTELLASLHPSQSMVSFELWSFHIIFFRSVFLFPGTEHLLCDLSWCVVFLGGIHTLLRTTLILYCGINVVSASASEPPMKE